MFSGLVLNIRQGGTVELVAQSWRSAVKVGIGVVTVDLFSRTAFGNDMAKRPGV